MLNIKIRCIWDRVWILMVWSENGCGKCHLWSEIGSGFGEPGGTTIVCSRLRDSWARWIEKARRRKQNGRKLRREGASPFSPRQLFACFLLSHLPHYLRAWNRLAQPHQDFQEVPPLEPIPVIHLHLQVFKIFDIGQTEPQITHKSCASLEGHSSRSISGSVRRKTGSLRSTSSVKIPSVYSICWKIFWWPFCYIF